MSMLFI
ncbi:UNVERIFIED_CONTAM: hypothetical protein GTU68_034629 [Idotea baltica]|nr:hypothetical protein [Idotea baltica]